MRTISAICTAIACTGLVVVGGVVLAHHRASQSPTARAVASAAATLQHQSAPDVQAGASSSAPNSSSGSSAAKTLVAPNASVATPMPTPPQSQPPILRGSIQQVTSNGFVLQTAQHTILPIWIDSHTAFSEHGAKSSVNHLAVHASVILVCRADASGRLLATAVTVIKS